MRSQRHEILERLIYKVIGVYSLETYESFSVSLDNATRSLRVLFGMKGMDIATVTMWNICKKKMNTIKETEIIGIMTRRTKKV